MSSVSSSMRRAPPHFKTVKVSAAMLPDQACVTSTAHPVGTTGVCVCVRVCRSQACYLATFPKYIILFSRVFICSDYISLYNYIYIPVYSARRTVTVAPFCCVALCWIIPDHSMDINVPYVNSACQATAISPIDLPCNLAVCYLSISTLSHSPSHHI